MVEVEDAPRLSVKGIWMLLLREGGHWSVGEICAEFCVEADQVCNFMNQMAKRGFLKRRQQQGKKMEYAVDRTCKIPNAVTIGEIMGEA